MCLIIGVAIQRSKSTSSPPPACTIGTPQYNKCFSCIVCHANIYRITGIYQGLKWQVRYLTDKIHIAEDNTKNKYNKNRMFCQTLNHSLPCRVLLCLLSPNASPSAGTYVSIDSRQGELKCCCHVSRGCTYV